MKFSLVDEVMELEPDKSILAAKNLTRAEEYLADHFPGFPVMPGVMMLETLVQASAWLMRISSQFEFSTILLSEAKALRFKSFVSPGDKLIVSSTVHKSDGDIWTFKANGKVESREVVSARLILKQFNLGAKDEKLKENDKRMIEYFKQAWGELERTMTKGNE